MDIEDRRGTGRERVKGREGKGIRGDDR